MNPFHALYHPDSEKEALQTDGEEEPSFVASPVGRKRRRITPKEPEESFARKMKTRNSSRKTLKKEPQLQEKDGETDLPSGKGNQIPSKPHTPATLMPPPVTPRTWRKREIPSSQSPADSPLSTQSRRLVRDYSRSPLKERSTNVTLPATSTSKGVLWARKLVVEDSLENEEEDSPPLTRLKPITEPFVRNCAPEEVVDNDLPQLPTHEIATGWRSSGEVPESSQRQHPEANISSPTEAVKATKGILDSDFEYDDEDTDNESTDTAQRNIPLPCEPISSGQISKHNLLDTVGLTPKPPDDQGHFDNPPALDNNAEDDPSTPRKQCSESDGASAQLFNDLQRATQPGGLQTESQYENAWKSYHPADAADDNLDENESMLSLPLIEAEDAESMPAPMTVPTQILPPAVTPFKRPVPPSQATTTDVTQPSPRNMPSSPPLVSLSSLPPMPPPLSSPTASRKAVDPWIGFQWDGVRLTDSQLLPASLMTDSYIGPPGGWDSSQEGYEE